MTEHAAISRRQIAGESPMVASEITENCVYTGLFGSIDSARMEAVTEKLTKMVESIHNELVIIDLGNVDAIDSAVAALLMRVADTMALIGVKTIFCGIKGTLARTMVTAGVNLGQHEVVRDLKEAVKLSYELTGYELVSKTQTHQ